MIALHMIATTECSELLKFPVLVEHYWHHRSNDTQLNFIQYLKVHYTQEEQTGNHHDHHLPFKSHEGCINLTILICLLQPTQAHEIHLFADSSNDFPMPPLSSRQSGHPTAIWQPPKSC
jgi:hypothetical protein